MKAPFTLSSTLLLIVSALITNETILLKLGNVIGVYSYLHSPSVCAYSCAYIHCKVLGIACRMKQILYNRLQQAFTEKHKYLLDGVYKVEEEIYEAVRKKY